MAQISIRAYKDITPPTTLPDYSGILDSPPWASRLEYVDSNVVSAKSTPSVLKCYYAGVGLKAVVEVGHIVVDSATMCICGSMSGPSSSYIDVADIRGYIGSTYILGGRPSGSDTTVTMSINPALISTDDTNHLIYCDDIFVCTAHKVNNTDKGSLTINYNAVWIDVVYHIVTGGAYQKKNGVWQPVGLFVKSNGTWSQQTMRSPLANNTLINRATMSTFTRSYEFDSAADLDAFNKSLPQGSSFSIATYRARTCCKYNSTITDKYPVLSRPYPSEPYSYMTEVFFNYAVNHTSTSSNIYYDPVINIYTDKGTVSCYPMNYTSNDAYYQYLPFQLNNVNLVVYNGAIKYQTEAEVLDQVYGYRFAIENNKLVIYNGTDYWAPPKICEIPGISKITGVQFNLLQCWYSIRMTAYLDFVRETWKGYEH